MTDEIKNEILLVHGYFELRRGGGGFLFPVQMEVIVHRPVGGNDFARLHSGIFGGTGGRISRKGRPLPFPDDDVVEKHIIPGFGFQRAVFGIAPEIQ